jgi:hypothetical protein
LSEVAEIVDDPSGEQLAEIDQTERRVQSRQLELGRPEAPRGEDGEIGGSELLELVEERPQGATDVPVPVTKPVVGLELGLRSPTQNDPSPGNPIGLLAVDEMPDDIERAEGAGTLGGANPGLGQVFQQGSEDDRGSPENVAAGIEVKFHWSLLAFA